MLNKRSFIKFLSFLKVINIEKSLTFFWLLCLMFIWTQITFNLQFLRRRIFNRSHLLSSDSSYFQRALSIKFIHIFSRMWLLVLFSIWWKTLNFATKIFLRPHEILKVLTFICTNHYRLFFGLNRLKTGRIENNLSYICKLVLRTRNRFNYNTLHHIWLIRLCLCVVNWIVQTLMHWFVLNQ